MQVKKTNDSYIVGDTTCSNDNQKYQIMQKISSNKKSAQQLVSTIYQHIDTFIVKKQSNKLYYILKRYKLNFVQKITSSKDSSSLSPNKDKNIIKQIKNKLLFHPNLLQIEQIFFDKKQNNQKNKYLLLIQEYCQQGDLAYFTKHQIKKSTKQTKKQIFQQKTVAKWLLQILLALQHLHFNKITHQFLNPQNIYLTPLGNLKLNQFYLLNTINVLKQMKKSNETVNSILDGYQPMLNQKKFKINQKKDITDFGSLISYLCNFKQFKDNKKQSKSKSSNHLPSSYSQDLDNIYLNCINAKKTGIQVKDILKTPYFLEIMREFIVDKKLNIPMFQKIPIKKYMIHKKTISPKFLKNKKKQEQKPQNQINEGKLPKIQRISKPLQTKQNNKRFDKNQQKLDNQVDLKKAMRASLQKLKNKLQLSHKQKLSRQKKLRKNSSDKIQQEKIIQKKSSTQKPKILTPIATKKGPNKNSLLPPPPSLPKNKRNDTKSGQQTTQSQRTGAKSSREQTHSRQSKKRQMISRSQSTSPRKGGDKPNQFKLTPDITFGKKSVSVQCGQLPPVIRLNEVCPRSGIQCSIVESKQSELQKISQNLAKIFSDLKIRQDDEQQLSFELDEQEQQQLRLTLKQDKQDILGEDNLMKTYKGKFDQIILQLQQKYQPNLQTIIQKTTQWDSNDFFTNRQLLKKLSLQDGKSLLPSSAFINEDYNNQYDKKEQI